MANPLAAPDVMEPGALLAAAADSPAPMSFSHGLCPDCRERLFPGT